ncbi:hypothetical protein HELRODRAFT_185398 [Helobdella robusta]|uniref:RRM domain-containing protein n=1 Tax=Helobdella robusta TaxID=6412 RepID=T1FMR6_HELRO|nr:hypothetical protein HELRODRAFT_185398 [Helobdella robusta]ESO08485.1 hypothetical protein HELRODRAFT_185398 [Helobdella robusta]
MATYSLNDSNGIYSSKRMKNNQGQSVTVLRNTLPSPVIHVRGLSAHVTESDLIQSLQRFGPISYVMTFPAKNMALVEFESKEVASRVISYVQENELTVAGLPAHFNFSVSEKIKRPEYDSKIPMEIPPSNVILLTIINARHPITVDVIYAICSPIATVSKIVIFRKNGVQVLVEFESIEDATKVKTGLHGADIYANSCTIKAEFGKPNNLTVRRNDQNTWDYTVSPSAPNYGYAKNKPLLQDPGNGHGFESQNAGFNPFGQSGHSSVSGAAAGYRVDYDANLLDAYGGAALHGALEQPFQNPNCVLMIYGLNSEKFTCQRLFNLICLYGDIVKIRFLKSKDGSAMVQMSDRDGCDRVMMMLRDVTVFGQKLSISNSKQPFVSESTSPSFSLPDGSSSFQDFSGSKNNRFGSPDALKKYMTRVQFPTKVVYFFNAPPNIDEETMMLPFIKAGAVPPSKMVMLPAKTERSSRGYLTFPDAVTATESLLVANNAKIPNPNGTAPYVIKLAFSAASPDEGH